MRGAVVAAALPVLALTGCLPAGDVSGRSAYRHDPVRALRVAQNDVVVAGPAGFCIDTKASRERAVGSFVILGSCAAMGGGAASGPEKPAVLTALISTEGDLPQAPTASQLERFFRSEAGRAALAHDGQADKVTLLQINQKGDVLILKVRDRSATRPEDLKDVSWRAVFSMKDRLVALSVHSHDALPMSDAEMRRTLDRFLAAMRAANGGGTVGAS